MSTPTGILAAIVKGNTYFSNFAVKVFNKFAEPSRDQIERLKTEFHQTRLAIIDESYSVGSSSYGVIFANFPKI